MLNTIEGKEYEPINRLIAELTQYLEREENANNWYQGCGIVAPEVPKNSQAERERRPCGACAGALIANFFAKRPELGVDVRPFAVALADTDSVIDFMSGMADMFGGHNAIVMDFVEWAMENTTFSELDEDGYGMRDLEEMKPDDWDDEVDGAWEDSDSYREEEHNMHCQLIDGIVDSNYIGLRHEADPHLVRYFLENGNKYLTDYYGNVYFYKDGFDALTKYVKDNSPGELIKTASYESVQTALYRAMTRNGASMAPWSGAAWSRPPSFVLDRAIAEVATGNML